VSWLTIQSLVQRECRQEAVRPEFYQLAASTGHRMALDLLPRPNGSTQKIHINQLNVHSYLFIIESLAIYNHHNDAIYVSTEYHHLLFIT